MVLARIVQSRLGRFAIVTGGAALSLSLFWAWWSFQPPSRDPYYYTISDGAYSVAGGDRVLFSIGLVPDYHSTEWKQYEYRCSIAQLAQRPRNGPAGFEYRGRSLCNSAALDDAAFGSATAQFKTYVDNDVWAQGTQLTRRTTPS
ncbi:hypothetical protein ABIB66_007781 [Bradyrhizobium sp. F1.13.3]